MRFTIVAAVFAALAAVAQPAEPPNTLSAAEAAQGWILLFDGKTLTGWQPLSTSSPSATGDWRISGGALVCPGVSAGWIAESRQFDNFVLKLEFRGAADVNSGVFIRSAKQGQPHLTGYEVQIWDHQPQGYTTGSLVGSLRAAGGSITGNEWNSYEIAADGDHFVVLLNGKKLLDGRDSKHLSAGLIGFQCQRNNQVEFRSIKIRPTK